MKPFILLLLMLLSVHVTQATHLVGGYVQAKAVTSSSLTYEITVALYLDAILGTQATGQTTSVSVCFGDGTSGLASRQSQTVTLNKLVHLSIYRIIHTYPGSNAYALTVSIPNRTIANNITNASSQLFTLNTTITTNVTNQTPTPGYPEAGFHLGANQKATILLKATDIEGDSLVYSLTKPLTSTDKEPCISKPVPSYQFPNDIAHKGIFKLNSKTGELVWDSPAQSGNYSTALHISEYRKGVLISQTTQEITLVVDDLPGTPSIIPPYEPAMEGTIVTAIINYADADVALTTFPSPVDDHLQVIIQTSNPTTAAVQLTDLNGRKLHTLEFAKASRQHEQVISMDSLTPGVYLLRADVDGRKLVRKIVKK